jgi:hypothetical protein
VARQLLDDRGRFTNRVSEPLRSTTMTGFSRVLIALAVLGVPVTAAAQRATDEVQRVPPGWLLTPSVGFGGSWDDNLLLAGEGDRRLEDFAMPVNSGLRLDYRGRRLNVSSSYDGSFVMYRSYEELNSADQRAHFRLEHQATSRLKLTAEEQFIRAPSTDALNITGVPFYRTGSITNEAGGGFEAIVARYTTLNAGYVLRLVTFDQRADQQLDDGYEHDVSVSLGRAFSRRLKLGGHYGLRREVLSDGQDQFNIHESGVNVEYALSPTFRCSAPGSRTTRASDPRSKVNSSTVARKPGCRARTSDRSFLPSALAAPFRTRNGRDPSTFRCRSRRSASIWTAAWPGTTTMRSKRGSPACSRYGYRRR